MSAYDYDAPPARRSYREETRLRPDSRYEPQDAYYRQRPSSRHELVPRPREDSDLSIEEVRRDFPPPGYRDIRRARSAEPGYDDYYAPSRDLRTRQKPGSVYYEEEERHRKRVMTKEQKIMAALLGGVIAAGAKEAWDRKEAKDHGTDRIERNPLASAALAAGGAFAGYSGAEMYNKYSDKDEKKSTYVVHKGRDGRVSEYYSDDDEDPRGRKGNKNFLENALSAAGLGGAIKALTGGGSDDKDKKSDTRSRRGSDASRTSRRDKSEDTPANRMQKAAKASLVAGAAEAFRVSKEPGGWKGEKMKRVLTAAAGAAAIDGAQDPSKDSKRHMLEAVVGGLVGNRVINGSRKDIEEDKSTGRSRSRSRSRGDSSGKTGLAALATAGLGALGAKKIMDNREASRDRSRDDRSRDDRSRRRSYDSYGSRSPSPRRRSRSRSVVDTARRSLAKIGLGSAPEDKREDDRYDDGHSSSRRSRGYDDRYDDSHSARDGYMRGGRGDAYYDERDAPRRSGSRSRRGGRSGSVSGSDLGNSDDDEKEAKKMKASPRADRYDEGPRYTDGNPYSASIPAPPVGYDRR